MYVILVQDNQLLLENNQAAGKNWIYACDNAGNILSKKEYDYTLQSDLSEKTYEEITYTYGNEQWGDLLTGYNGNTITYTTNGHPLNDGTWKYTWRHGRQLELSSRIFGWRKWRCSQSERM